MKSIKSSIKQRDAETLAHGYEGKARYVEIVFLGLYFVFLGALMARL